MRGDLNAQPAARSGNGGAHSEHHGLHHWDVITHRLSTEKHRALLLGPRASPPAGTHFRSAEVPRESLSQRGPGQREGFSVTTLY